MLPLDSPRWMELHHAYGPAGDLPALVRQIEEDPVGEARGDEALSELCNFIHHQGDVFDSSYAVVPHLVRILEEAGRRCSETLLFLPTSIEVHRLRDRAPPIPEELREAYIEAIGRLPGVAGAYTAYEWDHSLAQDVAAALVVAKGVPLLADAILELGPQVTFRFLTEQGDWLSE